MYCFLDELGNFVHTNYCDLISYNEAPGEAVRQVELLAWTLRLLKFLFLSILVLG